MITLQENMIKAINITTLYFNRDNNNHDKNFIKHCNHMSIYIEIANLKRSYEDIANIFVVSGGNYIYYKEQDL